MTPLADLQQWSYAVVTIHNPELAWLDNRLRVLGDDGWELVTSVSTHKAVAMVGNQLVFVFKKPGAGHRAPIEAGEGGQFKSEVVW